MMTTGCPTLEVLEEVLLGRVPGETGIALAKHLEGCSQCCERAAAVSRGDELSRVLKAQSDANEADVTTRTEFLSRLYRLGELTQIETAAEAVSDTQWQFREWLQPAQTAEELGRIGHYRVLDWLGTGGMGVVLRAEDSRLRRQVALKVLHPKFSGDAKARRRFLAEARALASIKHEHVVVVHDVADENDAQPFLAMELLEGESLTQWLARVERPSIADVLRIGEQVAEGLAAVHARGLVHRDVKPGNVWLESRDQRSGDPEGVSPRTTLQTTVRELTLSGSPSRSAQIKLLDFGLARTENVESHLTEVGMIVGTPAFMSPEQAAGEDIDARSDLFSLGSVLYLLCTGQIPFTGSNTLAVLSALANHTPESARSWNPDVPPALADLIARLLAKKPGERPASATDVAEELRRIESRLDTLARPAAAGKQESVKTPRSAVMLAVALVLLAGVVIRIKTKNGTKIEVAAPRAAQVQVTTAGSANGNESQDVVVKIDATKSEDERAIAQVERNTKSLVVSVEEVAAANDPAALSPLDALRRADIPPRELVMAGKGDPINAPAELVAVLGDSRMQHWGMVMSASFHPNGEWLATASSDGVKVWDVASGELRFAIRTGGTTMYSRSAFSPDGRWLAWLKYNSQGYPGFSDIVLGDAATGEVRATLSGHQRGVTAITFSPDGTQLAAADAEGWVKLWSVKSDESAGRVIHEWPLGKPLNDGEPVKEIHALRFAPGNRLLAGSWKRDVIDLLDTATGERVGELQQKDSNLVLNADGTRLATHHKLEIQIWEVGTWKRLTNIPAGGTHVVAFHPTNPDVLVVAGQVKWPQTDFTVWSLSQHKPLRRVLTKGLDQRLECVTFTRDGRVMAIGGWGGIQLWNCETWEPIPLPARSGHAVAITDIAVSADRGTVLTSGSDGTVLRWNMNSFPSRGEVIFDNPYSARSLALDESAQSLAIGLINRETTLLDLSGSTPQPTAKFKGDLVSRSRDGKTLLIRREGIPVLVTPQGGEQHRITAPETLSGDMTLSPDGQLVAITTRRDPKVHRLDGPTRIWNTATGEFIGELPAILKRAPQAFNPDGSLLATFAEGNTSVGLFEIPSGTRRFVLNNAHHPVHATFSPDGQTVAAAYNNGSIRLWDVRTGALVRELFNTGGDNLPANAQRLTFSADGRYLLTANANGTAYVLRLK